MQTTRFLDFDCVELANSALSMLVTQSVGPRVISLRYQGGENLFAELLNMIAETPQGIYHFYGGHRLWRAPEDLATTYVLDNAPVQIVESDNGLLVTQQEEGTGLKKAIHINLHESRPLVQLTHSLTNNSDEPMTLANWTITQMKPGGIAILPQCTDETGLLPNRQLVFWPYTDIRSPHLALGNRYLLIHANLNGGKFKVGFPNPRRWMGYWQAGTLFVKHAAYDPQVSYFDFESSSECYCDQNVLELETLSPIQTLAPGGSAHHVETWEVFGGVEYPKDEAAVADIVEKLGL